MKHAIIPDVQAQPGQDFEFLTHVGQYLVDKQPETVVCLGDFADMPSLSSYDVGKKSFEGRRYTEDIHAAHEAMTALLHPINEYNQRQRRNGKKQYKPRMVLTLGNHENRIERAVENDAKLEGLLSVDDLMYEEFGWEVFPFLEVVVIDGVAYSHYFTSGLMGRPCSTAAAQLRKANMSCISGHQQGFQMHTGTRADGKRLTSVIAGSCYEEQMDYLGPQGNNHYRGIVMLNDVDDGEFDILPVSLKYLRKRYE